MLDVKRLRLLLELSRRGTIAAVAQALSYSPSAVSQQLSTLEREAGTRLLEPVGRKVRLTAEGELLVASAQIVLTELERAEAELAASQGKVLGTVRIAAFQTVVFALVPAALIQLQHDYPSLRVEVTEMEPEQSLPALLAGDFDLVLLEEYPGHHVPGRPGTTRRHLLDDPLYLVTPASWGEVNLADVARRPFVLEPPCTAARPWAEHLCRTEGFEPDVRYTSTDLQIHLRLVRHGLAAALVPGLALDATPSETRVATLPRDPTRRILMSTRPGATRRPALNAVIDALRRVGSAGVS